MERDIRRNNLNEENNRAANEHEADRLEGFAAAEMADRGPKIVGHDRIERPDSEEGTVNNASYTPGDEDDDIDEEEDDLILGDEDELDDDDDMEVADVEIDDELDEDDFDEDDLLIDADDDEDEEDDL